MVKLSPECTSTTCPVNYLLLEIDDFVTFCSFQRPLPSSRADWATFFNSMNYIVVTPSMASFDSLAKPFSSKTFLTSTPSLDTKQPLRVSLERTEITTLTSLCRKEDQSTERIALALFFVSPSMFMAQVTCQLVTQHHGLHLRIVYSCSRIFFGQIDDCLGGMDFLNYGFYCLAPVQLYQFGFAYALVQFAEGSFIGLLVPYSYCCDLGVLLCILIAIKVFYSSFVAPELGESFPEERNGGIFVITQHIADFLVINFLLDHKGQLLAHQLPPHELTGQVAVLLLFSVGHVILGSLYSRQNQDFLLEASVLSVWGALEQNSVSREHSDAEALEFFRICVHIQILQLIITCTQNDISILSHPQQHQSLIEDRRMMLPTLRPSQQQSQSASQIKKLALSKASKASEQSAALEQRYEAQLTLNHKLKQLLGGIKDKIIGTCEAVNEEEDEIMRLLKDRRREETDTQHQAHILNILISENGKLKEQVDSERNKRAIYFNVYKNLEHEIHQWQAKYKNLLIESMKAEGAITKLKEKFRKATKKVQRDIISLNQQIESIVKFQSTEKTQQKVEPKTKRSKQLSQSQLGQPYLTVPDCLNEGQQKQKQMNPQKNRKSLDVEMEYELEQKTIEVNGLLNKLRHISGLDDLVDIHRCFRSIDQDIQLNFGTFKAEQRRQKQLLDKIAACEQELEAIETQNSDRKSTKILEIEGQHELTNYHERIRQLEKGLQEKIGVNVGELSNEMLIHHCLRVRDDKRQGKKNLEKYLEQTKKQKPEHTVLLNPREMHRKIIQGQLL